MELMPHQEKVLPFLDSGKVLWGGVGTGKTATALAYYVKKEAFRDIYVITTAKKRDSLDWEGEAAKFGIGVEGATIYGTITVDSWNNIGKYTEVEDAFFVFDEQRLVGHGAWVKSFLKIARRNHWLLLSATPGDVWLDYAPVFIANGWYKNITDFKRQHVLYAPYVKYPKVLRYIGEQKLERYRNHVLVEMPFIKHTNRIMNHIQVGYDKDLMEKVIKTRWNPYENRPVKDMSELFRIVRTISNSDPSRLEAVKMLLKIHPKVVIFYNFDYELEILRTIKQDSEYVEYEVAEWNGHRKESIPKSDKWAYLVQYVAGGEGWNCIETDAMILYSLTYSYKNYIQCQGRIDRLDTPFTNLFYYILENSSPIDVAVKKALSDKRNFNEAKSELFSTNNEPK